MGDFEATWRLTRGRFDEAVLGLTQEQLNWRMHEDSLTLGQMALHVAGVEISFISQLTEESLAGDKARVKAAATDGCVNDKPFPFDPQEITPELVERTLREARAYVEPIIGNPESIRSKEIVSALGPVIDGTGAMARLAYHPGYHQGQAHLVKTAPGFPGA